MVVVCLKASSKTVFVWVYWRYSLVRRKFLWPRLFLKLMNLIKKFSFKDICVNQKLSGDFENDSDPKWMEPTRAQDNSMLNLTVTLFTPRTDIWKARQSGRRAVRGKEGPSRRPVQTRCPLYLNTNLESLSANKSYYVYFWDFIIMSGCSLSFSNVPLDPIQEYTFSPAQKTSFFSYSLP